MVVYKKNFEEVHDEGLMSLKTILQEVASTSHQVDYKPREHVRRADFIARDLVIVFGGDGTLTSLSHNIDAATPVMGVNSHPRTDDPQGSYGFYMDSSMATFADDVQAVFAGEAIVNELPRLQALIETTSGNRFTTDPAMNDLLIANTHQYAPSKYHMRRGEQQANQQSSGLLFSTWFGQGAWLRNARRHGPSKHVARARTLPNITSFWPVTSHLNSARLHHGHGWIGPMKKPPSLRTCIVATWSLTVGMKFTSIEEQPLP